LARRSGEVALLALLALVDHAVATVGPPAVGSASPRPGVRILWPVVALLTGIKLAVPADPLRIVDVLVGPPIFVQPGRSRAATGGEENKTEYDAEISHGLLLVIFCVHVRYCSRYVSVVNLISKYFSSTLTIPTCYSFIGDHL
jgi:hypothetical protein